jgi:hypothetical protein
MTYLVAKRDRWTLLAIHDDGSETRIGSYPTRKAALVAARLLAGWRHPVVTS